MAVLDPRDPVPLSARPVRPHWATGVLGLAGCLLLVLLIRITPATADEPKPLRIAIGDNYAPYATSKAPDGGTAVAVARAAFAAVGQPVTFVLLPWDIGYEETRTGIADATLPYVHSQEREQVFLYSDPLYQPQGRIVSSLRRPLDVVSVGGLAGHRLCRPTGYASPDSLTLLIDSGDVPVVSPETLTGCLVLIRSGRADFLVVDPQVLMAELDRAGLPRSLYHISRFAITRDPVGLIVARSHPHAAEIIARFNDGLARIRADGTYQRLMNPPPP